MSIATAANPLPQSVGANLRIQPRPEKNLPTSVAAMGKERIRCRQWESPAHSSARPHLCKLWMSRPLWIMRTCQVLVTGRVGRAFHITRQLSTGVLPQACGSRGKQPSIPTASTLAFQLSRLCRPGFGKLGRPSSCCSKSALLRFPLFLGELLLLLGILHCKYFSLPVVARFSAWQTPCQKRRRSAAEITPAISANRTRFSTHTQLRWLTTIKGKKRKPFPPHRRVL